MSVEMYLLLLLGTVAFAAIAWWVARVVGISRFYYVFGALVGAVVLVAAAGRREYFMVPIAIVAVGLFPLLGVRDELYMRSLRIAREAMRDWIETSRPDIADAFRNEPGWTPSTAEEDARLARTTWKVIGVCTVLGALIILCITLSDMQRY